MSQHKFILTPFKLSVLTLLHYFTTLKPQNSNYHDLLYLILSLIHSPEVSFVELSHKVKAYDSLEEILEISMKELSESVDALFDFMTVIQEMVTNNERKFEKESVFGQFIRQCFIQFQKMDFKKQYQLLNELKSYINGTATSDTSDDTPHYNKFLQMLKNGESIHALSNLLKSFTTSSTTSKYEQHYGILSMAIYNHSFGNDFDFILKESEKCSRMAGDSECLALITLWRFLLSSDLSNELPNRFPYLHHLLNIYKSLKDPNSVFDHLQRAGVQSLLSGNSKSRNLWMLLQSYLYRHFQQPTLSNFYLNQTLNGSQIDDEHKIMISVQKAADLLHAGSSAQAMETLQQVTQSVPRSVWMRHSLYLYHLNKIQYEHYVKSKRSFEAGLVYDKMIQTFSGTEYEVPDVVSNKKTPTMTDLLSKNILEKCHYLMHYSRFYNANVLLTQMMPSLLSTASHSTICDALLLLATIKYQLNENDSALRLAEDALCGYRRMENINGQLESLGLTALIMNRTGSDKKKEICEQYRRLYCCNK